MTVPAAVRWSGADRGLVGRDAELETVRTRLEQGSRTAVVCDLPGSGKTALLAAVRELAARDGRRVLALTCHESEREIAFSALAELLRSGKSGSPLLSRLLGSDDDALEPLRLRMDVFGWFLDLSGQRPLVVVVDDVQWCDDASLSVLAFVAHRLADTEVSMLFAARGTAPPAPLAGHPRSGLPPLPERAARELLRGADLDLDAVSLPTVLERAAGNPLALLEFGRAAAAGATDVAITGVEAVFGDRVRALPEPSRWVLLLASAGDGDLGVLGRVVPSDELVEHLAPAELDHLVQVADHQVRFSHPLARSAAYATATTAERLRAHRALAAAHDGHPEREAWHLAAASVVPDDALAARLDELAEWNRRRGTCSEAARFLHRAAELTPDKDAREARLMRAVILYSVAGRFDWVERVATQLRETSDNPVVRAGATHTAAYALAQTDRNDAALAALHDVLGQLLEIDVFWGWTSLSTMAVLAYRTGGGSEQLAAWLARYEAADATAASFPSLIPALRLWVRVQLDPLAPQEWQRELVRSTSVEQGDVPLDVAGSHEMILGAAAWLLEEPTIAVERLTRAVDLMRRAQSPGELPQALGCLAMNHIEAGDLDAAERAARTTIDQAESRGLNYSVVEAHEMLTRVMAIRGDVPGARELWDRTRQLARGGETLGVEVNLRVSMSRIRFAERDVEGAWDELRWLFLDDGTPRHVHVSYRDLALYVATAVRAGAAEETRAAVAEAEHRLARAGRRHRLQLDLARGLLAGDDAEPLLRRVTGDPATAEWPLLLASGQLEHGAWLRRRHRQGEARDLLHQALRTFERMGVAPWAELTRAELRAAGVAESATVASGWGTLTPQERSVVQIAATGRSNREIAAALFVSPRTVSTHLYNAFPKLGITSRAQLGVALRDLDTPDDVG